MPEHEDPIVRTDSFAPLVFVTFVLLVLAYCLGVG